MKVQITQQNNINSQKNPRFGGVLDGTLRFLATNQGVGANLTDISFMVMPRILTDAQRGPDACLETTRREASGTMNHSLIGLYGVAGGSIAAALMGIDRKFGTSANKIMTAPETLNILAGLKAKQIQEEKTQIEYIKSILKNLKAYNPTSLKADKNGFINLADKEFEKTTDDIAKIFDLVLNKKDFNFRQWEKSSENSFKAVMNLIISETGAESKYVLESGLKNHKGEVISSTTNLKQLVEDIYKVSEAFNKEEVKKAFKEQIESGKSIHENKFIKSLSRFNKVKAIAGVGIGAGIGMSIQPLNIYLTKLKTGSDGFVGVEGRSKDDSAEFKAIKGASALAFASMVMATLQTNLKGLLGKMAFTGFWPSIAQLKGIYGLTIISRILATRDKDELREALTKDTLGFLSWLVLGDFVNRITAECLDKSVVNRTKELDNQSFLKRVFKSSLKTRDEILIEALTSKGVDVVKNGPNGTVAKSFKEMIQDLQKLSDENFKKITKKRLKTLNMAQMTGYAFSGLVLGLGIPNLNIYITNKLDKQRKEKALGKNNV